MDGSGKWRVGAAIAAGVCALSVMTLSAGTGQEQDLAASDPAGCESGPDPAAGNLQFSTSSLTVAESAGDRALLVIRDGGGVGPVSATVTTADGTATVDDYAPVASTVSFPDGDETARVVRVPIVPDLLHEADETFTATLSDSSCATIGARAEVQVTIIDDDPETRFSVGGTVTGLQGSGLVLRNVVDDIPASNGSFAFPAGLVSGSDYAVTVRAQPVDPDQTCTVSNGNGVIADTDVTDVAVDCVTLPPEAHLDPAFGTDGKVTTPGLGGAETVAIQPDGKIVAAGPSSLARYNSDGTLDSSFAQTGSLRTGISAGFLGDACDVALPPDGSIVVVGVKDNGSATGEDFAVQRYTASGTADPNFGTGGTVTTDFNGSTDRAYAVAVQAGRQDRGRRSCHQRRAHRHRHRACPLRVATGPSIRASAPPVGSPQRSRARRVSALPPPWTTRAGSCWPRGCPRAAATRSALPDTAPTVLLDQSFDDDGIAVTAFGLGAIPHGVAVDDQDRIVVVGQSQSTLPAGRSDIALVRFGAAGRVDTTFDGDGLVTTDFPDPATGTSHDEFGRDLALQSDGGIVVCRRRPTRSRGRLRAGAASLRRQPGSQLRRCRQAHRRLPRRVRLRPGRRHPARRRHRRRRIRDQCVHPGIRPDPAHPVTGVSSKEGL